MAELNKDDTSVKLLASKIWGAINEVDPDPMHPNFEHFDDEVKDELLRYSAFILNGFPGLKVKGQ